MQKPIKSLSLRDDVGTLYTVTFNSNGGSAVTSISIGYNTTIYIGGNIRDIMKYRLFYMKEVMR